jgi:chorismate dehydratase
MLRVGAVSYLNTKPLVYGLEEELRARIDVAAEVRFDVPSRLAEGLAHGRFDVALIPAIEFFRGVDYQLVSNAVIACRGPVWSVRLLSRVPLDQIRTLALDEGSRTSQALVQVLLWQQFRLRPRLQPFPLETEPAQVEADALLMIGDRAMHPPIDTFREIWDLGDRWCRWSELPFVFAVWAARKDVKVEPLVPVLQRARDRGVQRFEEIAATEAGPLGLSREECVTYFAENLHFHLGPGELRGLELFRHHTAELGLLDESKHALEAIKRANVK